MSCILGIVEALTLIKLEESFLNRPSTIQILSAHKEIK